jgi:hippurate hydrolase
MVSRDINPLEPAVISVGSIHGGMRSNIIPDRVELQLSVRADTPAVRARLLEGVERVARGTALALGVPENLLPIIARSPLHGLPTINDAASVAVVRSAIATGLGGNRLTDMPRAGMFAEDFALFVTPESGVRGVYFQVGGTAEAEVATAPAHHSPLFRIEPEPSVTAGVEAMVVAAEALLRR